MTGKRHERALEYLIKNLDLVDEHPHQIEWIMPEGYLFKPHCKDRAKMCDLLIGYDNNSLATALELKGCNSQRNNAIVQLNNGYDLLKKFGYEDVMKKIVYYKPYFFHYEILS